MKGWTELKEAFWAAVDADPAERARRVAALSSIDPALAGRLEALLAADDRGESLQQVLQFEPVPASHPARIGAYEVVGVLGAGGMGEVYRARDVRLQREVAVKVLPASLTNDRDRLARFEREAQALAALNHPNIAQVYGLDESSGRPALVMELVPGPTLATVIAGYSHSPMPVPQALALARQIADGLDAAHEKGIVHRDLKPGNMALTQDGGVKILDFGLAKTFAADPKKGALAPGATDVGLLLGTPAYMSPEQARGSTVDKRTDIWSFGCVVYELLTGRQAFAGNTASDSLVAVLERHPDMTILPAATPSGVRSLLNHCLEKDPKRRVRDIADARLAIDDALNPAAVERPDPEIREASKRTDVRMRAVWMLAGFAIAALAGIVARALTGGMSAEDPPRRTITSLVLPQGMRFAGTDLQAQDSRFAISPDGRRLVLVASDESGGARLWLRDLASAAFHPLPQTEGASYPFWSPDSESIGFVAAGRLRTIRLSDDTLLTVSEAGYRQADWSRNNRILFAPAPASPLYVASASGGAATAVTTLDKATGEVQHSYPAFLPDARHFLYFSVGSRSGGMLDPRGIYLGSLDPAEPPRLLLPGATQARYANGHLVFVQDGTLMAQPFALESQELRGTPFPLVEDIKLPFGGATGAIAAFSVSDNGVLVYQAALRTASRPVWLDRTGRVLSEFAPGDYGDVALSPDGTHLAVSLVEPGSSTQDLWLHETDGGRRQRFTYDPGDEFAPVWSPDGQRLLFSSRTKSLVNLHIKDRTMTSSPPPLEVDNLGLGRYAADWSRDGRHIMYIGGGRAIARSDLWLARVAKPREARALLDSSFVETHGRIAPDCRWFAYVSNESGQLEVYVDRFPDRGAKRLVSTKGGRWPRWASTGSELFYVTLENQLVTVSIQVTGDRLEIGVPRALFAIRPPPRPARLDAYPYDVSPDRRRFVVNTLMEDTSSSTITVVVDWPAVLRKR